MRNLFLILVGFLSVMATAAAKQPAPTPDVFSNEPQKELNPPKMKDVEWERVPYEKAENEVVALFQRDLQKLEEATHSLTLFEVKTIGRLPPNYSHVFRNKLERVLLTDERLHVKDCQDCDQSRLVKLPNGDVRYESFNSDPDRPLKVAKATGAETLLTAELNYTPEELQLRLRLVDAPKNEVVWTKEYSTADVTKTRERYVDIDKGELGTGDSLARVLIGEIAFTTVFSPGVWMLPTINTGDGAGSVFCPGVDILIGEKYDSGHKRFGFVFGAAGNLAGGADRGSPLPFALRMGPQYRYSFNPYNINRAIYSVQGEIGGFLSTGLATAYLSVGPEITMMRRFSIALLPTYILPATVMGNSTIQQLPDGTLGKPTQSDLGKFGGFAMIMKGSINW